VSAAETLEFSSGTNVPPAFQGAAYAPIGPGTRGKLRWLPVERLFVPEEYQRALIARHTHRRARAFESCVFGALLGVYAEPAKHNPLINKGRFRPNRPHPASSVDRTNTHNFYVQLPKRGLI
jgi:hypothetical protein